MSGADVHRRFPLEIINEGRLDIVDEIMAPDYVEHVEIPGFPPGLDGLREWLTAYRAAFPDLKYTIVQEVGEGDKHLIHARVSGTMKGDFMGMPATNKSATWDEMHVAAIRNGKVTEHWAVLDRLGMLQGLGVIPSAPGA